MMGLKRGKKALDYISKINRKYPVKNMNRTETEQLLLMLGWNTNRDYKQARRILLKLSKNLE